MLRAVFVLLALADAGIARLTPRADITARAAVLSVFHEIDAAAWLTEC